MQNRNLAIDAYRGLTIAFMIIVNTPGTWDAIYPQLRHATWHGCTATDLVFPSFLFIVGASMWFAFEKYNHNLTAESRKKILKRTLLIFVVGLALNGFPFIGEPLAELRIMGVLQRIALSFGIAAFLCLGLSSKWLIRVSILILLGYWGVLYYFSAADATPYSLEGNAVRRLDLFLFGKNHLWQGTGIAFDPEGLLSSIPAAITVVMGWFCGSLLARRSDALGQAVFMLLAYGVGCITVGLLWGLSFPINKALWTSSYVLYSGGCAMLLLAAMTWFYEMRKMRLGYTFLNVFGRNPLFAYVLSAVLVKLLFIIPWPNAANAFDGIYHSFFEKIDSGAFGSLLFAVTFMLICWITCWALYRKKVFIKI